MTSRSIAGDSPRLAVHEVLEEISALYSTEATDRSGRSGLLCIAEDALLKTHGLSVSPPRCRLRVMLLGNHSAGKSSFINWYIGESIQKTGVALETREITVVTHGQQRATIDGEAAFRAFKYAGEAQQANSWLRQLKAEVCASKLRNFRSIDFIDTPGLVECATSNAADREAIVSLARLVDVVLVFFDPIGQATCKATLDVLQELNDDKIVQPKLRYCLSKVDTIENEGDRYRLLTQITQGLSSRFRLPSDFALSVISLPRSDSAEVTPALDELCQQLDRAVDGMVQRAVHQCGEDVGRIKRAVEDTWSQDRESADRNRKDSFTALFLALWSLLSIAAFLILFIIRTFPLHMLPLEDFQEIDAALAYFYQWRPALRASGSKPFMICGAICLLCTYLNAKACNFQRRLSKGDRRRLELFELQLAETEKRLQGKQTPPALSTDQTAFLPQVCRTHIAA